MIPSSVKNLGPSAFKDCMQLEKDGLEHGLRNIFDGTFSGYTSLRTANIPSLAKAISLSASNGCDYRQLTLMYPQEMNDFV